jgi:uncharacterized membrane protein
MITSRLPFQHIFNTIEWYDTTAIPKGVFKMTRYGLGLAQRGIGMMGTGGWIFMGLACLLVTAVLVFCLVVCIKYLRDRKKQAPSVKAADNGSALAILNDRLARGEVSPEDYQKIKAELTR